ncbi:hypothetical protein ACEWY4_013797 [Coilia grayii]|uniref:Myb/SANT-like DNA-binding domain-containing protein n=1 Tax=Coilia grayii TaxID=363190 RepID=A0ABD1JXD8_9TELE
MRQNCLDLGLPGKPNLTGIRTAISTYVRMRKVIQPAQAPSPSQDPAEEPVPSQYPAEEPVPSQDLAEEPVPSQLAAPGHSQDRSCPVTPDSDSDSSSSRSSSSHSRSSRSTERAGGVELADIDNSVVGHFTSQELLSWEAVTSDPWVLDTLSRGYSIQFKRGPPWFTGVKMTTVRDKTKALALRQEIKAILDKGAIEPIELSPPPARTSASTSTTTTTRPASTTTTTRPASTTTSRAVPIPTAVQTPPAKSSIDPSTVVSVESEPETRHRITLLLLSLFETHQIFHTTKKAIFYQKVSKDMERQGYAMTPEEVRKKLNNMLVTYKRIKDREKSTGEERVSWEYYTKMDDIFGGSGVGTAPPGTVVATPLFAPAPAPAARRPSAPPARLSTVRATRRPANQASGFLESFQHHAERHTAALESMVRPDLERWRRVKERRRRAFERRLLGTLTDISTSLRQLVAGQEEMITLLTTK